MDFESQIANSLLDIAAVGFSLERPITFKSGLVSPVYLDNRRFPFYPHHWRKVIRGLAELLEEKKLSFDVIAGIETAGIPHSAALGYRLRKPTVFVRKAAKDHGTKKLVEGGDVAGLRVLLIEDHITTAGSSLAGVASLRTAGATVTDCLSITSYGFKPAENNFAQAGVKLHTLTNFSAILQAARKRQQLSQEQVAIVEDWLRDPTGWQQRKGKNDH